MSKPYETFDIDLLAGKVSEDSVARLLCSTRFEVKLDRLAAITGNLAVEYEVKKGEQIERSGISITTAEWWIVEFSKKSFLVFHVDIVKRLARLAIKQGRHKWIGDGGNHHNALVPFFWFLRAEPSEVEK